MTSKSSQPERPPLPEDLVDQLNRGRGGFNELLDLRFVRAGYDEVVAELSVSERHHQPYGLVHGGVYTAMVETLASVGAALNLMPVGRRAVGLENATSFVRAVRSGVIRATALPITRGRRTQVWEVTIRDADERVAATGRVRMLALEDETVVAGEALRVK